MAKKKRTEPDYPLEPRTIHKDAWFYETKPGLLVVAELRNKEGAYLGTVQTTVKWRSLAPALANHSRVQRRATAEVITPTAQTPKKGQ